MSINLRFEKGKVLLKTIINDPLLPSAIETWVDIQI